jgi:hypothetical protein
MAVFVVNATAHNQDVVWSFCDLGSSCVIALKLEWTPIQAGIYTARSSSCICAESTNCTGKVIKALLNWNAHLRNIPWADDLLQGRVQILDDTGSAYDHF